MVRVVGDEGEVVFDVWKDGRLPVFEFVGFDVDDFVFGTDLLFKVFVVVELDIGEVLKVVSLDDVADVGPWARYEEL